MRASADDEAPELSDLVEAVLHSSRALVAVSARSIADGSSVTFPQYRMLVVLNEGATNLSSLADSLDVAPSTAMRMVERLSEAGLIDRQPSPDDRRQVRLSLTPRGHRVVTTVTERRRRDLRAVVQQIPARRRRAVAEAMAEFAAAADRLWRSDTLPR